MGSVRAFVFLFAFGLGTSLGYLAYGTTLASVSFEVLFLTTFVCLTAARCYQRSDGVRFPAVYTSGAVAGVAITIGIAFVCYWVAFWTAMTQLRSDPSAAALAVAMLGLTTILNPISLSLAEHDSRRKVPIWISILLGATVIVGIVLIRLDSSFDAVSLGLPMQASSAWIILPLLLLVAAVVCEAIADYFFHRLRQDVAENRPVMHTIYSEDAYKSVAMNITREDLKQWVDFSLESDGGWTRPIREISHSLQSEIKNGSDHKKLVTENQTKIRSLILTLDSNSEFHEISERVDEEVANAIGAAAVNLACLLGLFVSILLFVRNPILGVEPADLTGYVLIIAALFVLGLAGAAARPVFVVPLEVRGIHPLGVAPIYAFRSLIFLIVTSVYTQFLVWIGALECKAWLSRCESSAEFDVPLDTELNPMLRTTVMPKLTDNLWDSTYLTGVALCVVVSIAIWAYVVFVAGLFGQRKSGK